MSKADGNPFDSPRWGDISLNKNDFVTDKEQLTAYEKLEWVSICVDSNVRRASSQTFNFINNSTNKKIDKSLVNSQILDVIENGYFNENFNKLIERVIAHRQITGNAYLLKSKTNKYSEFKKITDTFIPLKPQNVKPIIDQRGIILYGYEVMFDDGTSRKFNIEDIIHFTQNAFINPFVGIGNITKMRLMASGEAESQEFVNEFMEKRAAPSMVITSNEDLLPGDFLRKQEEIRSSLKGRNNRGEIFYMPTGPEGNARVTLHDIEMKDLQFIETKVHNRQTIISMFGCYPSILGIPQGVNRATSDNEERHYNRNINKILQSIENDFNKQFIHTIDNKISFVYDKYPTGDINQIKEEVKSGIITPARASELLGESIEGEEIESRNMYYIPNNLIPIDMASENHSSSSDNEIEKNIKKNNNKEYDLAKLSNPKNVDLIVEYFSKTATKPKYFQIEYLKKALNSRNKIEDKFAFEWAKFFKAQGQRIIENFDKEFGHLKAVQGDLSNPEKAASLIYNLNSEGELLEKEITRLHTSGIQKGIQDINEITLSAVNHNLSNPYVVAAVRRLVKRATGFRDKGGRNISINDATWKDMVRIFEKGIRENLNVVDLSDLISRKFENYEGYRARRIARTESRAAWDAGAEVAYKEIDVKNIDVIGCENFEIDSDCGAQNRPIIEMSTLSFHPNHLGVIVPSKEI
ncbi:MAG: phage portal protein [Candidatus Thorarchaeota archaeon]